MSSSMARLIALLTLKERTMEEMVRILSEEQSRIIDMNPAAVAESNLMKEEVISRLSGLSEECQVLMASVGAERGLEQSVNLSLLIGTASDLERQNLLPLQRRLVLLAGSLNRQQELSRMLLTHSLGLIQRSMALFSKLLGGCDTYGARGRVSTGSAGISFLSREI